MPPKRKNALPDSIAANQAGSRTELSNLGIRHKSGTSTPIAVRLLVPFILTNSGKGLGSWYLKTILTELVKVCKHFPFLPNYSNIFVVSLILSKLRAKTTFAQSLPHEYESSDEFENNFIVPDMNDGNKDGEYDLDSSTLFVIKGKEPLAFHPINTVSVWKEPSSNDQRVSMAISFSTGIGENPGDLK